MGTGNNERMLPQLVMIKRNLADLPEVRVPEGYSVRAFRPGDELAWERIINEAFNNKYDFNQAIKSSEYFRPERVIFACYGLEPVATATSWFTPNHRDIGYLHMVGCLEEHRGKGLGYLTSLAALQSMSAEQKEAALLQTDDFRLAAIKIYLKLGFAPWVVHANQTERWQKILELLGHDKAIIAHNLQ